MNSQAESRRTSLLVTLSIFTILLCGAISPAGAQIDAIHCGLQVQHLANEGFLITGGEHKVLIDALFGDGLKGYPAVPKELREQIETAQGDFADVDLVLASHFHGDHFAADSVAEHLRANPRAHFVSTRQAADALLATGIETRRVAGFWPSVAGPDVYEHRGLKVTALRFHHGGSKAQNLGLLIDICGQKVLHVGDTEINPAEFAALPLDGVQIDIALFPNWYFGSKSLRPVLEAVGARHLIAMHFPSADAPSNYFGNGGTLQTEIEACQQAMPDAWMAHRPGDSRSFDAKP